MHQEQLRRDSFVLAFLEDIARDVNNRNIVVVKEDRRTCSGCYNYKTARLIIVYKPGETSWEEPDVRDIVVKEVTTGFYTGLSEHDLDEIVDALRKMGFKVEEIELLI